MDPHGCSTDPLLRKNGAGDVAQINWAGAQINWACENLSQDTPLGSCLGFPVSINVGLKAKA